MPAASTNRPPAAPTGLTVDDDAAPLAVTGAPAFGWIVNDPDRNETQRGYELIVSDAPGTADAHGCCSTADRLRAASSRTCTRRACGSRPTTGTGGPCGRRTPPVRSGRTRPTPTSTPASATATGTRRGSAAAVRSRRNPTTSRCCARRRRSARARSCAPACTRPPVSSTSCRVNGTCAAHGPSFSYPDEQYYETTDVTNLVRAGRRRTCSRSSPTGRLAGQGRPASPEAFIAHITVDYADGNASGDRRPTRPWRTHTGPWIPGPPAQRRGRLRRAHRRTPRPGRLGPSRIRRPRLAAADRPRYRTPGRSSVTSSRRGHTSSTAPSTPITFTRLGDGAYVADFGTVTAATPVVEIRARCRRPAR